MIRVLIADDHAVVREGIKRIIADTDDVMVFRPSDYSFPPSRGRRGFEVLKNGEFVRYGIAPTDGMIEYRGRWEWVGKGGIAIRMGRGEAGLDTLELVSLEKGILKIKK